MRVVLPAAITRRAAAALAAAALATATTTSGNAPLLSPPPAFAAAAAAPTPLELTRLSFGLARIEYLLDNWDTITTVCSGTSAGGDLEDAQIMRTQNQGKCFKTPLVVQKYIGAASTLDPLFKADKLMIRAEPLVSPANQDAYASAVDDWITKQQMSSTMAYTSSWSGIENPNGSVQQIEENLLEAKKEVLETRATLKKIVALLGPELVPASPKFNPNDSSTWPAFK